MRVFILGLAISVSSASLALAADVGQYRPGTPYQSVIAQSADVCESHCSGDAQCRSWNYVQPNRRMAGVCEFNATNASPIPSPVSVSGVNSFGHNNSGSNFNDRLVAGGTNTIRVGTQSAPIQQSAMNAPQSNRRIVREPLPQNIQAQAASTRPVIQKTNPGSLTAQQNQYRSGQAAPSAQAMPSRQVMPMQQARPIQQARPQHMQQGVPPQYPQQMMRGPSTNNNTAHQNTQYPQSRQSNAVPQFRYDLGGQATMPAQQMRSQAAPNAYAAPSYNSQMRQPAAMPQNMQQPMANVRPDYRNRRHQQGPSNRQAVMPQNQMQQLSQQRQMQPNPMKSNTMQASPIQQSQIQQGPVHQGQAFPPQGAMPQQAQNYASAPPQSWPAMTPPTMERRTANRPMTHMDAQPSRLMQKSMEPQSAQSLAQGLTAEQAQQSLFGKLNDDVRGPSSGLNVPTDPNAPIAMSSSRPSGVVEQGQLGGLVGAPSQ